MHAVSIKHRLIVWLLLLVSLASGAICPCGHADQIPAEHPIVRVGIETGNSSLSHLGTDGQPEGFLVDLVQAIARERNLQVILDYRPWVELLADFKAGKVDVIANMVFTPEREKYADFSMAHLVLPGGVFIQKRDRSIRTPADLQSKKIASSFQGYSYEYALKHDWAHNKIQTSLLEESLSLLDEGKVDFVLATKVFAEAAIRERRFTRIEAAPFKLDDFLFQYHFAVKKGNGDLLYTLNSGLFTLRTNGTIDDLYGKWIGPLEPRRLRWSDLDSFLIPGIVLVLVLGMVYLRQLRLLRKLRQQTEALKSSEERLTLILQGSQDAFWDWNVKTNQVTRSPRWGLMSSPASSAPAHEPAAIGTLEEHIIYPDDVALVQRSRERMLSEGHSRAEYRVRGRNGEWIWILDRGQVVARDSSGRPTRVTGAASDITARKRIEEALGRSQTLLEQSQRAADIGGWEYDATNGVLYWTLQAFRIHDLDPDSGSPSLEPLLSFYQPQAQAILRNAFQAALAEARSFDVELELRTANQRTIWVRTIGRAEKNANRVIRIYGSFQDVTHRKKADDERQKLQLKMLEAQKLESLGVLAGGIAHDFNNLLTVITGNASIAREDPPCAPESLQQIEIAAQRAADLCRQMLAYAGRSRTSMEIVDFNQIVRDTVHLLRLSISKSALLEFVLDPQSLPVEVDVSQIRQVIMNLVINASDALGDTSGRIRVLTSRLQVTASQLREARPGQELPPGDYVSIEVQDDGCGMSSDTLARIFDPFFTTKFTGRGLGLAAVLGIVRTHNGAFFVQSTLGKGSSFRMLLPPTKKSLPEHEVPATTVDNPLPATTPGLFLVVDDEPHVRKLAGTILERHGHRVALASDGYEALALTLARGDMYTAILLDMTMPGLDGPSTLREFRQMRLKTPVLIMSGYSEYDVRQRFPDDPLLGFLSKPFTAEDLLQRLQELLNRAKFNSDQAT